MAEAIGFAAGVAGLISLTIQLTQLSHTYISDARNAPRAQKSYLQEVIALTDILSRLKNALQESESSEVVASHIPEHSDDLIALCAKKLSLQQTKLQQNKHRLIWPFYEREAKKATEELHRFRSIFSDCLTANMSSSTSEVLQAVRELTRYREQDQVREWLRIPIQAIKEPPEYLPGTDSWFLDRPEFKRWLTEDPSLLWCCGPPGAGKSVLASIIGDHVWDKTRKLDRFVLRFYADAPRRKQETDVFILKRLLQQISEWADAPRISQLNKERNAIGASPTAAQFARILERICSKHTVFLIIDAVDELDSPKTLIPQLETFVKYGCRVIVTSRDNREIAALLSGAQKVKIMADEKDLKQYVEHRFSLSSLDEMVANRHTLLDAIVDKAGGMYVFSKFKLALL